MTPKSMNKDDFALPKNIIEIIINERKVRTAVIRQSHLWFFNTYFPHYVTYQTAPFQHEIFSLTEDISKKLACIVAFRGSGKSTIITMSFALWSILGIQQKKFVLILCQTKSQAKQHMMNLRRELESNNLLKNDLGPFQQEDDEWGASSLVFSNYGARITVASTEQSIRGLRHHQHRPQVIICDDVEDLSSVKTKESRDKTYQWFTGEVIPAGDTTTRTFIVGNLLHEDCLIMRLRRDIEENRLDGVFKSYPLIGSDGDIAWPGKYPNKDAVEQERLKTGSESAWQREYLLRIVTDEDQIVCKEWIHYYRDIPDDGPYSDFRFAATGIDLAISELASADYTAMVSAKVYGRGSSLRIYILPNPVNERLDFPKTVDKAKAISEMLGNGTTMTKLYIENVGYQESLIQQLLCDNYPAGEFKVHGQDKRSRLALTTHLIQAGKVLFPEKGAGALIQQLVGFGKERHDDLADAFSVLIHKILETDSIRVAGYEPLISEHELEKAFVDKRGHLHNLKLGIVIGGENGKRYSVILLRSQETAQTLYKGPITDPKLLAEKTIDFMKQYSVQGDYNHICPEETRLGQELYKGLLAKIPKLKYPLWGINLGGEPEFKEQKYINRRSESLYRAREWIRQGGKLIGRSDFNELLDIYRELREDGRFMIMPRECAIRHGFGFQEIAEALALTFARTTQEWIDVFKWRKDKLHRKKIMHRRSSL